MTTLFFAAASVVEFVVPLLDPRQPRCILGVLAAGAIVVGPLVLLGLW
jgi:hypothetical protein